MKNPRHAVARFAVAALCLAASRVPAALGGGDDARRPADLTCGPRCVQALLRLYGRPDEELLDLVREIQWPDLESGSTLRSVAEALGRRDIYTDAMTIGPGMRLRWPHPAVVHMKGGEGGGHYVLWAPSGSDGYEKVWEGVQGWAWVDRATFDETRSGTILLTSPVPIQHPESAAEGPADGTKPVAWSIVVISGIAIGGLAAAKGLGRATSAARETREGRENGPKDQNPISKT